MSGFGSLKAEAQGRALRSDHFRAFGGLSAHERHLKFLRDFRDFYGGGDPSEVDNARRAATEAKLVGTDLTALHAGHRFIRSEQDDADVSWEARLAARYYQRLFKEYCIADLSRFKESKLGLRWRTEQEVISGKGQFICGAKGCDEKAGLCSYEVNFAYQEAGQSKQALVKLRVCPACAHKLNYKREKAFRKAHRSTPSGSGDTRDLDSGAGSSRRGSRKRVRSGERHRDADEHARASLGQPKRGTPDSERDLEEEANSGAAEAFLRDAGGHSHRARGRPRGADGGGSSMDDARSSPVYQQLDEMLDGMFE